MRTYRSRNPSTAFAWSWSFGFYCGAWHVSCCRRIFWSRDRSRSPDRARIPNRIYGGRAVWRERLRFRLRGICFSPCPFLDLVWFGGERISNSLRLFIPNSAKATLLYSHSSYHDSMNKLLAQHTTYFCFQF